MVNNSSIDFASSIFEPLVARASGRAYIGRMTEADAMRMMAALGQPVRLAVLNALARAGAEGIASSDLADLVGVPRNLMSAHLAVLSKAEAVASRKDGRSVVYVMRTEAVSDLLEYLSNLLER